MPYIKQERRDELNPLIEALSGELLSKDIAMGDYNYVITTLMHHFILNEGLRYKNLNDIVGMLECCKLEFVRKIVSPYEDLKTLENGSVSVLDGGFSKLYDMQRFKEELEKLEQMLKKKEEDL